MYTFEQLISAVATTGSIRVLVRDTAASSIVTVLKRKYRVKITLEQAQSLQRAAGVEAF